MRPMGEDTLVLDEAHYGFRRHLAPRRLVEWTLRQAAFIRCISPMLEHRIAGIVAQTSRRVVPLNVSGEAVQAAGEPESRHAERRKCARSAIEADWGPGGRRLALVLGRLHPFKGLETLVHAMPEVHAADRRHALLFGANSDQYDAVTRCLDDAYASPTAPLANALFGTLGADVIVVDLPSPSWAVSPCFDTGYRGSDLAVLTRSDLQCGGY